MLASEAGAVRKQEAFFRIGDARGLAETPATGKSAILKDGAILDAVGNEAPRCWSYRPGSGSTRPPRFHIVLPSGVVILPRMCDVTRLLDAAAAGHRRAAADFLPPC